MKNKFFKFLLKLTGWSIEGSLPKENQYIIIAAPHTSNWDFIIAVMLRGALNEKIFYLGKSQLFKLPWGWFFSAMGGKPVDRTKSNNLVDAVVNIFKEDPYFKLALAPEGTRSAVKKWKTGFYYIAKGSNIPIVPCGLDFKKRTLFIAEKFYPGDSIENDLNSLISYFRKFEGKHPKEIPNYKLN